MAHQHSNLRDKAFGARGARVGKRRDERLNFAPLTRSRLFAFTILAIAFTFVFVKGLEETGSTAFAIMGGVMAALPVLMVMKCQLDRCPSKR
jgi:hypothetical protein